MLFITFLVDGGWSEWQNVTECSATCGEGVITQHCTCIQPSPSCGGRDCVGESTTNVSCTEFYPGTVQINSNLTLPRVSLAETRLIFKFAHDLVASARMCLR